MKLPHLIVFDIDATLLKPSVYYSDTQVREGLYDPELLTTFLKNPDYQVALASFNQDGLPNTVPIGGRRLGRIILNLQHPDNNSSECVEDDFIQAWQYKTFGEMTTFGKNKHLQIIINTYQKKYGSSPPEISLFDDAQQNVYLANQLGVYGYWVSTGLTKNNISTFMRLGFKVLFSVDDYVFYQCVKEHLEHFIPFIKKTYQLPKTTPIYSLYLPSDRDLAKNLYKRFIDKLYQEQVNIYILLSDINHIV